MTGGKLDMVTFEVLRHRLWEINDEMALIAGRISGSPAVYESGDFNTAILSADGKGLFTGVYIMRQAAVLDLVVRSVRELFEGEIHDGDMFVTNDPWYGALHAMDMAVVAPVFWDGEIVAWTGIVMHELDMGGPRPGSWSVGARNAYEECPLFPPLKLVDRGELRRDVEAALLRVSRTAEINALNLRARIACQQTTRTRLLEIVQEIGRAAWLELQEQLLEYVRTTVRQRLTELPEGTWHAAALLDHDGVEDRIYEIRLALTKTGDRLILDFRGTDGQAQGPINCATSGLVGGVLQTLFPLLCFDLPWSAGAVLDCVEIIAEPGTVNNALFPAPTSMATVNACQTTGNVLWEAMGAMFGWSTTLKEESTALGHSCSNRAVFAGTGETGRFVHLFTDPVGGGGARSFADGIDTCGNLVAPAYAIPNVERIESLIPVLYVYRKERVQTAGAGTYRGGAALEMMLIPYGTEAPIEAIFLAAGSSHPEGKGAFGGYPGSLQRNLVLRQTDLLASFQAGRVPDDWERVGCAAVQVMAAKEAGFLAPGDAWVNFCTGGGGYGDPLERDPVLVARDVRRGLCAPDDARELYGVVLDGASFDGLATERARREQREARRRLGLRWAARPAEALPFGGNELLRVGPALAVRQTERGPVVGCRRCEQGLALGGADPRIGCLLLELPLPHFSPLNRFGAVDEMVVRLFCCPGCGTSLFTDVTRGATPVAPRVRLATGPAVRC